MFKDQQALQTGNFIDFKDIPITMEGERSSTRVTRCLDQNFDADERSHIQYL
jgi:hypothetical protein